MRKATHGLRLVLIAFVNRFHGAGDLRAGAIKSSLKPRIGLDESKQNI